MKYFGVIGNRDHIKIDGEKRPFWEFLDRQPDGWLTSLAYKREDYPLDRNRMIWDCGAWSYKREDVPKLGKTLLDPQAAITLYEEHAKPGDFVVAPDHMLIEGTDLDFRRDLNQRYAESFLRLCPDHLVPLAVTHGMNDEERVSHALQLEQMGYSAISVGGVAARASQRSTVISAVSAIRDAVPDVYLHVLGLSSPSYCAEWQRLGVQSCDGSSHFKQAFTGGAFFTVEGAKLTKHQAARPGEEIVAPECGCIACSKLRNQGIDTRSYGSNENNMGRAAHNMNMLMQAQRAAMRPVVVLVACCGAKKQGTHPAGEIYQSALFKKSKAWAEQNGDAWAILSAMYGVLDPDEPIYEYDLTLGDMTVTERSDWSDTVQKQILDQYPDHRIVVLAGNRYCEWITDDLDVVRPMKGMGIGQQLSWLTSQIHPIQEDIFSCGQ